MTSAVIAWIVCFGGSITIAVGLYLIMKHHEGSRRVVLLASPALIPLYAISTLRLVEQGVPIDGRKSIFAACLGVLFLLLYAYHASLRGK
jgi:chromate transport protein ChrA